MRRHSSGSRAALRQDRHALDAPPNMRSTWSSLWKTCSSASSGRAAQFLLLDRLLRIRLSRRELPSLGAGGGGGDNSGIDHDVELWRQPGEIELV
jgi:hypothetical protein